MEEKFKRKSPEDILKTISKLNRGNLKVILGSVAGVGKTYHLLLEGYELKKRGIDVVMGVTICPTYLKNIDGIESIECIAPIVWDDQGSTRFDLDIDTLIKRNPEVVLVDELSHINRPGIENHTRLDDVIRLLNHKISVITTLNIYEFKGLKQIAEDTLGIRIPIQHFIPEDVLEIADDIRLLDVSPNVILERLQERVQDSTDSKKRAFDSILFKRNNIAILRELALRYVAEEVNMELDDFRKQHGIIGASGASEKVLVSVQYHGNGSTLIRRGQQIAKRLGGDLLVVCFLSSKQQLLKNEIAFKKSVKKMVEKVGGEFEEKTIKTKRVAEQLVDYAMKNNVTRIVIGQSKRSRLEEFISGSFINKILRRAHNIDIFIVADRFEKNGERVLPAKKQWPVHSNSNNNFPEKEVNIREQQIAPGTFTIYIGAAPGVGKTYTMLREANQLKEKGIDIVIGLLETHDRKETKEQIGSLEMIPLKRVLYKNTFLHEMDTENIIKRNPEVVLVDELAHTNVVGSKNSKRYQDVEEIIKAGISVISTLNIQHIESLHDLIYQLTGVRVHETVPDYILNKADEIQLIDISPVALRKRMREGNIYAMDKVEQSLNHFFKMENLIALRELALREVADDVDERLELVEANRSLRGPWRKEEVIFVCVNLDDSSELLIRRGFRVANRLKAKWYVCYIKLRNKLTVDEKIVLDKVIALTERLGGTFNIHETTYRRKVVSVLVEQLKNKNATQVIIGQSAKSRTEELITGSIVEKLLQIVRHLDVLVVAEQKRASIT